MTESTYERLRDAVFSAWAVLAIEYLVPGGYAGVGEAVFSDRAT